MKTLTKIALVVAAVAISANAYAGFPKINTGNSTMNNVVNKSVSAAKNKAIADDINKNIQKLLVTSKTSTLITSSNKVVVWIASSAPSIKRKATWKLLVWLKFT
ncbi:MAG: hypothetical protein H7A33_07960 [Deltaproteobacteria bacterium]|nr:hypothetical protein [Deltaproteobacteria bacterium]